MIEVTDEDIIAMVNTAVEFKCLNGSAMEAAVAVLLARHPEWQVQRPMHEPASDEEVKRFRAYCSCRMHEYFAPDTIKSALAAFLAGRAAPEKLEPMQEPPTDADVKAAIEAYAKERIPTDENRWVSIAGMRAALTALLARRAAPQREKVVVTEEMRQKCWNHIHATRDVWSRTLCEDAANMALEWLADRLNGAHEKPADPRVAILREYAQETDASPEERDREIVKLLAKLDEAMP